MNRYLAALCLSLVSLVASPALAVDPPAYTWHQFASLMIVEIPVLVEKVDGTFYGKVNLGTPMTPSIRTIKLFQFPTQRSPAILQLLKDSVGEVIRVEGVELETFVDATDNEHAMFLVNAREVPE